MRVLLTPGFRCLKLGRLLLCLSLLCFQSSAYAVDGLARQLERALQSFEEKIAAQDWLGAWRSSLSDIESLELMGLQDEALAPLLANSAWVAAYMNIADTWDPLFQRALSFREADGGDEQWQVRIQYVELIQLRHAVVNRFVELRDDADSEAAIESFSSGEEIEVVVSLDSDEELQSLFSQFQAQAKQVDQSSFPRLRAHTALETAYCELLTGRMDDAIRSARRAAGIADTIEGDTSELILRQAHLQVMLGDHQAIAPAAIIQRIQPGLALLSKRPTYASPAQSDIDYVTALFNMNEGNDEIAMNALQRLMAYWDSIPEAGLRWDIETLAIQVYDSAGKDDLALARGFSFLDRMAATMPSDEFVDNVDLLFSYEFIGIDEALLASLLEKVLVGPDPVITVIDGESAELVGLLSELYRNSGQIDKLAALQKVEVPLRGEVQKLLDLAAQDESLEVAIRLEERGNNISWTEDDLPGAIALLERAVEIRRAAGPLDAEELQSAVGLWAGYLHENGDTQKGLSFYANFIDELLSLEPRDHDAVAGALFGYALFLEEIGNIDESEYYSLLSDEENTLEYFARARRAMNESADPSDYATSLEVTSAISVALEQDLISRATELAYDYAELVLPPKEPGLFAKESVDLELVSEDFGAAGYSDDAARFAALSRLAKDASVGDECSLFTDYSRTRLTEYACQPGIVDGAPEASADSLTDKRSAELSPGSGDVSSALTARGLIVEAQDARAQDKIRLLEQAHELELAHSLRNEFTLAEIAQLQGQALAELGFPADARAAAFACVDWLFNVGSLASSLANACLLDAYRSLSAQAQSSDDDWQRFAEAQQKVAQAWRQSEPDSAGTLQAEVLKFLVQMDQLKRAGQSVGADRATALADTLELLLTRSESWPSDWPEELNTEHLVRRFETLGLSFDSSRLLDILGQQYAQSIADGEQGRVQRASSGLALTKLYRALGRHAEAEELLAALIDWSADKDPLQQPYSVEMIQLQSMGPMLAKMENALALARELESQASELPIREQSDQALSLAHALFDAGRFSEAAEAYRLSALSYPGWGEVNATDLLMSAQTLMSRCQSFGSYKAVLYRLDQCFLASATMVESAIAAIAAQAPTDPTSRRDFQIENSELRQQAASIAELITGLTDHVDPERALDMREASLLLPQRIASPGMVQAIQRLVLRLSNSSAAERESIASALRLRQSIMDLKTQQQRMLLQDGETQELARLADQIDVAEDRLEEILGQAPDLLDGLNAQPIIDLADIQSRLPEHEAIIAYVLAEDDMLGWLITPTQVQLAVLPSDRASVRGDLRALRSSLDPTAVGNELLPIDLVAAHRLWQATLGPFERGLKDITHLRVVPDGFLARIPYPILLKQEPTSSKWSPNSGEQPDWLARNLTVSLLPSLASYSILADQVPTSRASQVLLGLGNPSLTGGGSGTTSSDAMLRDGRVDVERVRQLPPLPETHDELTTMLSALDGDGQLLLGDAFSEDRLASVDWSDYQAITFATHGLVPLTSDNDLGSVLVLTPPDSVRGTNDGLLSTTEISGLALDAEVVILSACNTAISGAGDRSWGGAGFAEAFLGSGARTVVMSQWPVVSHTAEQLTVPILIAAAQSGSGSIATSLRQASLDLIDSNPTLSHPLYWAPFVVIGDVPANGRR